MRNIKFNSLKKKKKIQSKKREGPAESPSSVFGSATTVLRDVFPPEGAAVGARAARAKRTFRFFSETAVKFRPRSQSNIGSAPQRSAATKRARENASEYDTRAIIQQAHMKILRRRRRICVQVEFRLGRRFRASAVPRLVTARFADRRREFRRICSRGMRPPIASAP